MSRSVYDIDLYTFIYYRHILCKNSDSALPFKVIIVKDELSQLLLLARLTRLIYHPVHERCLAVVHMSDDCYVSNIHNPLIFSTLRAQ